MGKKVSIKPRHEAKKKSYLKSLKSPQNNKQIIELPQKRKKKKKITVTI